MKHVYITYRMRLSQADKAGCVACITLPISDDSLHELLEQGEQYRMYEVLIRNLLIDLSMLQGYHFVEVVAMEEVA